MDSPSRDLRTGLRLLVRNPAFAGLAILTLALAICVNTAIFSVVDAVLFAPLPYSDPGEFVTVVEQVRGSGFSKLWLTQGEYLHLRNNSRTMSEIGV